MTGAYEDLPLSHGVIELRNGLDGFIAYLQTALKYHPRRIGLLFQKDHRGQTAYERSIKKYGKDKTFNVIKQCIPTDTKLPILHHVIKDAPQFMNDFSRVHLPSMYHHDEETAEY